MVHFTLIIEKGIFFPRLHCILLSMVKSDQKNLIAHALDDLYMRKLLVLKNYIELKCNMKNCFLIGKNV